jgi:hypothetical protein
MSNESTGTSFHETARTMREAAPRDNAGWHNPDFDFCEGCFLVVPSLPRGIVRCHTFPPPSRNLMHA